MCSLCEFLLLLFLDHQALPIAGDLVSAEDFVNAFNSHVKDGWKAQYEQVSLEEFSKQNFVGMKVLCWLLVFVCRCVYACLCISAGPLFSPEKKKLKVPTFSRI